GLSLWTGLLEGLQRLAARNQIKNAWKSGKIAGKTLRTVDLRYQTSLQVSGPSLQRKAPLQRSQTGLDSCQPQTYPVSVPVCTGDFVHAQLGGKMLQYSQIVQWVHIAGDMQRQTANLCPRPWGGRQQRRFGISLIEILENCQR